MEGEGPRAQKRQRRQQRLREAGQRLRRDKKLQDGLQQAAHQVAEAQQALLVALVAAHARGLSIRRSAWALGLSSSRVHQLLHSAQAEAIRAASAAPTP
jgi:hypothetical protein